MSDMAAYLSVTDVLVLPYINASQSGNTVMAYSAGIPVVCTDVGGLPEMVDDGKSGYVISPEDPQAIAEAVVKCLDEENYAKMSEYAISLSKGEFGWETIAKKTIEVYDLLS